MKRVLIVEDDPNVLKSLYFCFKKAGYAPEKADSLSIAISILKGNNIDLVVTDYQLSPYETGMDLINSMKGNKNSTPVVMISGMSNNNLPDMAISNGAYAFLRKPLDIRMLLDTCKAALE